MATILELADQGVVIRIDPDLDSDELEERCIYVFPHVINQIEALAGKLSATGHEIGPDEQLDDLFSHFARGGSLHLPRQFHELRHREAGIWELKTTDLRLFGWFYQIDCFICTDIADATTVKHGPPGFKISGSLYNGFGGNVARLRGLIALDEPKFIDGDDPANVVSNFTTR